MCMSTGWLRWEMTAFSASCDEQFFLNKLGDLRTWTHHVFGLSHYRSICSWHRVVKYTKNESSDAEIPANRQTFWLTAGVSNSCYERGQSVLLNTFLTRLWPTYAAPLQLEFGRSVKSADQQPLASHSVYTVFGLSDEFILPTPNLSMFRDSIVFVFRLPC